MQGPLSQSMTFNSQTFSLYSDLEQCHRLSLLAQIPELGILIVGSPKGRVAVFSLGQSDWFPRTVPVYFNRLDWLLPFGDQEERGERPESRLAGIAVSPMQGHIGKMNGDIARKWRLLLYYTDHSVLSYELSKKGGGGAGFDDLVL
jgi:hypothetical protein